MKLKLYLVSHRLTIKEFCETINYSRNQISGVMNGKLNASKKLAKIIEKATNGEVKAEEILKINKGDENV
jgi:transcriptional regulator with XRE-family HTH domain